jgi:hypothetical protein
MILLLTFLFKKKEREREVKETNMRGGVKSGREREVSRVRDAD